MSAENTWVYPFLLNSWLQITEGAVPRYPELWADSTYEDVVEDDEIGSGWHGTRGTFEWVQSRWTGFGAPLTTYEERERDIRWKDEALDALDKAEGKQVPAAVNRPESPGPGRETL